MAQPNLDYQKYRKAMDKQSIQETLRKSRQVEEQYKKFLLQKAESDKSWAQTEAKIDRTLSKLSETKNTIREIDLLYQNYQKSFENAINSALQRIEASKLLEVPDPNFKPQVIEAKEAADLLKKKKKILFMTGAGISAASGIPTFRDKGGYWEKKKLENITPQEFLTLQNFRGDPFVIWQWLDDFYLTKKKCKPNIGHVGIDILCKKIVDNKRQACIVTQNIDNFHPESQITSKQKNQKKYKIYEVHGNILKIRCDNCSKDKAQFCWFPYEKYRQQIKHKKHPECPNCKQRLRPHIMFFDEFYQQKFHHSDSVKSFAQDSDLLVVVGTALQTGLARLTVESYLTKKIDIIQINTDCIIKHNCVKWMTGKGDQIISKIKNAY